jgi:gamma-glutamyl hydrolase
MKNGFVDTGRELLRLAREANEAGDFFPVWGTCLGFEFMAYEASGGKELRTSCGAWNVVDILKLTKGEKKCYLRTL